MEQEKNRLLHLQKEQRNNVQRGEKGEKQLMDKVGFFLVFKKMFFNVDKRFGRAVGGQRKKQANPHEEFAGNVFSTRRSQT